LTDAGIVVVAAAGNNGKSSSGQKIYGRIHSPGNETSAITVGASNSFGSDQRGDDSVTSFSSRGPTRSFWADENGVHHYDNSLKPDLVAPGNRIIGAAADDNVLLTAHPELDAGTENTLNRRMMYLSGSSMAAPLVSGASAVLLQANPNLTPSLVKAVLMYTAQPLAGANTFEQGAGEINVQGAMWLAKLIRTDLTSFTPLGAPLLTGTPPAQETSLNGESFSWSQGVVLNHAYLSGADLITKYQKVYGDGYVLADGITETFSGQTVNFTTMTSDILLGSSIVTSDGTVLSQGPVFLDLSLLLNGGLLLPDGIMVADGIMVGDGVMVGDSFLHTQSILTAGDETSRAFPTGSVSF
jgi:subtilisin family serine protease